MWIYLSSSTAQLALFFKRETPVLNMRTQFTANELIHLWFLITLIKHLRDEFEQISVGSTALRSQKLQTNEPQHLNKKIMNMPFRLF